MADLETMDTVPGNEHRERARDLLDRVSHQTLRIGIGDPISVLPTMFARSTAAIAVVLDEGERPVGMIQPAALLRTADTHGRASLVDLGVADIMAPVTLLSENAPLKHLVRACTNSGQSYVALVADSGKLVGVISALDLVGLMEQLLTSVEVWQSWPIQRLGQA